MKTFKIVSFLFLIFFPCFLSAQKEASVWTFGSGKQITFQPEGPVASDFPGNQNTKATICDKDGNLVLYTDGRTVWNKNHEILINGEDLIAPNAHQENIPIFLPYPKKEGWYILIYDEIFYNNSPGYDNTLYYAEISTLSSGGKGEVLNKKIKIHNDYHSGPTIAGYCDNSYYWLLIDRNDNIVNGLNIDRFYLYKIDENGVNKTPVINDNFQMGNSALYKFSPNGDKFCFYFGGNDVETGVVTDFNFKTGEIYNYRYINDLFWSREFSPDSRLFYVFRKEFLVQFDVSYTNSGTVLALADTLLQLPYTEEYGYPGGEMQLAPDGKIYFFYYDVLEKKQKLARINKPNVKGAGCNVELNLFPFKAVRPPRFLTSFFRDKNPVKLDEVFPDAGQDQKICSESLAVIGTPEKGEAFYQWFPEAFIADRFSSQTTYTPVYSYLKAPKTETLKLRATDGNCWVNIDQANITIQPRPTKLPVDGSWSVCPFVERVDYWTEANNDPLNWLVDGGEIVTDNTAKNVKINWFETNPKASVSVFSQNQYKCFSDTSVFPVRINVELITETPKGPEKICVADSRNVEYQIRKTNGSVYEWIADGGKIVKGNGTNSVTVEWFGEGLHAISVEETSTTIDTVCFGESTPLQVEVFNDSLEIELENVSYTPEEILRFSYSSQRFDWNNHDLYLIFDDESGNFESTINLTGNDNTFFYMPASVFVKPEIFRLKVVNSCSEAFESNPQQIIIVEGKENLSENTIDLNWNINKYWEGDDLEHEIWCLDEENGDWKLIGKTGIENSFSYRLEGLSHIFHFRIYEFNKTKNSGSWSNRIKVEIEGQLIIPDVFTPNGDGINDTWEIANIRFHQITKLVVFDRYGKKVFECRDNYIPWEGRINGEVRQGTYLYQVWFVDGTKLNGQITVLQ